MVEIRPAATVVLLRDEPDGLHTLLLRRNSALGFAAGAWVFPGGRVEPEEIAAAPDELEAARSPRFAKPSRRRNCGSKSARFATIPTGPRRR